MDNDRRWVIRTTTRTGYHEYDYAMSQADAKSLARKRLGVRKLPPAHDGPFGGHSYGVGGKTVDIYKEPSGARVAPRGKGARQPNRVRQLKRNLMRY